MREAKDLIRLSDGHRAGTSLIKLLRRSFILADFDKRKTIYPVRGFILNI